MKLENAGTLLALKWEWSHNCKNCPRLEKRCQRCLDVKKLFCDSFHLHNFKIPPLFTKCEKQLLFPATMTCHSTFCETTLPVLGLWCWINSVENCWNSQFSRRGMSRSRAQPRETSVSHVHLECTPRIHTSDALVWPLAVAFACANWQVVTVIHKWAGSRPRKQGHHSILRSRRGHLIVIIVMPDAAPCRHSHAYRRHQEVTRHACTRRNRNFFRVWAPCRRSSLLPAERLPKSFIFAFVIERAISFAINGKLIILYDRTLVQNADNLTETWRNSRGISSRCLPSWI